MPEPAGVSIQVPGLACSVCAATDLVAIAPGTAPVEAPGLFDVTRGEAARAWCWGCWPVRAPDGPT